jgi:hypothetical protein
MLRHSRPLKEKKDKYVNGYGSEDESEEEEELEYSDIEDLFQELDNMLEEIEKSLENISESFTKIDNEVDNTDDITEHLEGTGDWSDIQDYLKERIEYFEAKKTQLENEINKVLPDKIAFCKLYISKYEKNLRIAKQKVGHYYKGMKGSNDAEKRYIKLIEEANNNIPILNKELADANYLLPMYKTKVRDSYSDIFKNIDTLINNYKYTSGSSSKTKEAKRILNQQSNDLHKLLALTGNIVTPSDIESLDDDGIEARKTLAMYLCEAKGYCELGKTDYLKNEDGYRNELFFQKYILNIPDPKINPQTFLDSTLFYQTADFRQNGKIYELKSILGNYNKLRFFMPIKKVNDLLAENLPIEVYWFTAPNVGWLTNHTFNTLTETAYKGGLYKLDLNNQTFTNSDKITVAEAKKRGWKGVNQDSYFLEQGDIRIQKV